MAFVRSECVRYGGEAAWKLLAVNGLTDLAAVFRCGEPIPCRHKFKCICKATLRDGDRDVHVFIKRQWKRARLIPRWPDIRDGMAAMHWPEREWWGLQEFRRLGFNTPTPLALFCDPWYSARSAVVTTAVPCDRSLRELVHDGTVARLDAAARSKLIDAVVAIIERIHDSGHGWRAMSIKHFFPALQDDGGWRTWLIDCEKVHARITPHYVLRDRRDFLAGLRAVDADAEFYRRIERRLLNGHCH